jgi:hypothetical protein
MIPVALDAVRAVFVRNDHRSAADALTISA